MPMVAWRVSQKSSFWLPPGRSEVCRSSPHPGQCMGDGQVTCRRGPGSSHALRLARSPVRVAEDLNEDGHIDLATVDIGDSIVSVLLGDGAGVFGAAQTFPARSGSALAALDQNGAGHVDLLTSGSRLIGHRIGTSAAPVFLELNSPVGLAAGDLKRGRHGRPRPPRLCTGVRSRPSTQELTRGHVQRVHQMDLQPSVVAQRLGATHPTLWKVGD